MRGILVRVAADSEYGEWHCPVEPDTNLFVYVPIWDDEEKRYRRGLAHSFRQLEPALNSFNQACRLKKQERVELPSHLSRRTMHLDPDFEHLTYGDNGDARGSDMRCLLAGDFLAFYAGLSPVRLCTHNLVYALVGLFVIERITYATHLRQRDWHKNAHTRWQPISKKDIVVWAKPGISGRLTRCIPIGELRKGAYRVRKDLLAEWGNLSIKNGFIQRSARPPRFLEPERFYSWFREQRIPLIQRNN